MYEQIERAGSLQALFQGCDALPAVTDAAPGSDCDTCTRVTPWRSPQVCNRDSGPESLVQHTMVKNMGTDPLQKNRGNDASHKLEGASFTLFSRKRWQPIFVSPSCFTGSTFNANESALRASMH